MLTAFFQSVPIRTITLKQHVARRETIPLKCILLRKKPSSSTAISDFQPLTFNYSVITLRHYFNILVIGPLECGCHSLSEGGAVSVSSILCLGGVWWLARGATGHSQKGTCPGRLSLSFPDLQPACGVAVLWPTVLAYRLWQSQIVCVELRVADTFFILSFQSPVTGQAEAKPPQTIPYPPSNEHQHKYYLIWQKLPRKYR